MSSSPDDVSSSASGSAGPLGHQVDDVGPGVDWPGAAASLRWIARPGAVQEDPTDGVRVDGGRLNLCFNALDRHVVAGRSDETALVADVGGAVESWSWARLLEDVAAFAGALRLIGAAPRTPVLVALPAGPDAVVALLACLRLGATAYVVPAATDAATFAALVDELAPPVVLTGAGTAWREGLDRARHQVGSVVVRQPAGADDAAELTEPRDLEWGMVARAGRNDPAPCERVAGEDPAYGVAPGGRVRLTSTGAAAVAAAQQAAELRLGPEQVWWPALDPASAPGVVWGVLAPLVSGAVLVVSDAAPGEDPLASPVAAAHHVTASARTAGRTDGGVVVEHRSGTGDAGRRSVQWRDGATLPDGAARRPAAG